MGRRKSFAVKPDEPVASFALVSSIMPRGAAERPHTYKWALIVALVMALGCAIFGWMPLALMIAAFAIPVVYIVYLYDVNLWEDEPVPVVVFSFVLTFLLALGFTWAWWHFWRPSAPVGRMDAGPSMWGILLFAVVVPVVGELIRQIGPVVLASRPAFDDLMDGLTFGIISGVAYACAETLVTQWDLVRLGFTGQGVDPLQMASLLFLHGFVKPLLYGTATGIAAAEFSGLGKRYDGFTPRYVMAVLGAIVAVAFFNLASYLFGFLDNPSLALVLTIVAGVVILGVLILRVRNVLHLGLMEAAMESAARQADGRPDGDLAFCGTCEMPLMPAAAFCNACGAATRTAPKTGRRTAAGQATASTPQPAGSEAVAAPTTATATTVASTPVPAATTTTGPAATTATAVLDQHVPAAPTGGATPATGGATAARAVEPGTAHPTHQGDAYYDSEEGRA